jgi:hypothetical protein
MREGNRTCSCECPMPEQACELLRGKGFCEILSQRLVFLLRNSRRTLRFAGPHGTKVFRRERILDHLRKVTALALLAAIMIWPATARGQKQSSILEYQPDFETPQQEVLSEQTQSTDQVSDVEWHYGGFVDVGYLLDFNHPANHLFRSRSTTFRVDEVDLDMAGLYVRKEASEKSRWGAELTLQAGKDSEGFAFSPTAPHLAGSTWLRHLGPTNVSYLVPFGKGVAIQGGIFSSLVGYDSLYAKDNFNYTRPWMADVTPYLMMGVNALYPFTRKLSGTLFVINGYSHLAHANNVPSSGGQLAYKPRNNLTLKETVLYGPQQSDTALEFWRFLSDSIAEEKMHQVTFAFEYVYSAERVNTAGTPRALMIASQLPVHWALNRRWSATVRPEVFWDRDGRWTSARQTVKAVTTTLEYRIPYRKTQTLARLEHRYDDSRGPQGGFFRGAETESGTVGLVPAQNLLILGVIFTLDH